MLKFVASFWTKKKKYYCISRNEHGKWFVTNENGYVKCVQKGLNASEIVRYLANELEGK